MLIDWFTVAAQIVNFLILVWFLKRFLYKPVLNAIDERERKIAAQINEAAERNAEAEKQKALFLEKNRVFEQEREALKLKAVEEVKAEKQALMDSVNKEYSALRTQRDTSLLEEERGLRREIAQKTQTEVFAIARKLLSEMASSSLEERMMERLIGQLQALPPEEREKLAESFRSSSMPLIVRSTFDLPEVQKEAIEAVIADIFGDGAAIKYETSPELISGIELTTNGYKVSWNMAEILTTAGKYVGRILQDKTRPVVQEGGMGHGASQSPSAH